MYQLAKINLGFLSVMRLINKYSCKGTRDVIDSEEMSYEILENEVQVEIK